MKRLGILLAALGACALVAARETPRSRAEPRWWKGNTHAHTLWSDGDGAPELVADWYRSKGYHFLVLSDHNVLSTGERWFPISAEGRLTPARVEDLRTRFGAERVDVREVEGRREMRLGTLEELRGRFEAEGAFLFIEGEEITDAWNEQKPVHVNGLNLAEAIPPQGGATVRETLQRNVDAVLAQGERLGRPVLAHVNHPNFGWGLTASDLASLRGDRFFEVYNGHPAVRNRGDGDHAGTEEMWDIALALRLTALDLGPLYGIATDDAHSYFEVALDLANAGRGWVMVRAEGLTVEALLEAMQRGDFYASSGVTLEDVAHDETSYTVRIAAEQGVAYSTRFVGTRLSDSVLGEIGELLLETEKNPAVYAFAGDELYVRATVVSSRPHPNPYAPGDPEMAWTQPAVLGSEENPLEPR